MDAPKCLIEISDQVFHVLDADGDSYHVGGDAGAELLFGSHLGVRAGARMQHAGSGVADVNDQRGDLEVLNKGSGSLGIAFETEGENSAGGVFQEILPDSGIARMAFESRINDPIDLPVALEELGQGQRIPAVLFHAQVERLQAQIEQKRIEGTQAGAKVPEELGAGLGDVGGILKRLDITHTVITRIRLRQIGELAVGPVVIAAVDDHAAQAGRMTVDVLGRRVNDDIGVPV